MANQQEPNWVHIKGILITFGSQNNLWIEYWGKKIQEYNFLECRSFEGEIEGKVRAYIL